MKDKSTVRKLLLTLLMTGMLTACQQDTADNTAQTDSFQYRGQPVANVNGEDIPDDIFQAFMRMRGQMAADPEKRQQALENLIDLYQLEDVAERSGLMDRSTLRAEIDVSRKTLIAQAVLTEFTNTNPVTDEDVRREYETQVGVIGNLQYNISHILLTDEAEAVTIIDRLGAGESFNDVMMEKQPQLGATNSGNLGWVDVAQMPGGLGETLKSLQVGKYSPQPVSSEYGYHILYLEDTRPLDPPSFEDVKENIRQGLRARKIDEYLKSLRGSGDESGAG